MKFNADGYLDPGLHPMSVVEIEHNFVSSFPHSSTRPTIIDGFKRHQSEISAIAVSYDQLIDGSFVTNKNDPGDIDTVCFIDGDFVDALPAHQQQALRLLFLGPATKATHHCDAYFCPSFPETHKNYAHFRAQRKYWMGEFGYDRSDKPKGIVSVKK